MGGFDELATWRQQKGKSAFSSISTLPLAEGSGELAPIGNESKKADSGPHHVQHLGEQALDITIELALNIGFWP